MKALSLCLFLLPLAVQAQPAQDDLIVTQLNSHLLGLKNLPPVADRASLPNVYELDRQQITVIRQTLATQRPDQEKAMRSYADAMSKFYRKPVIPWNLAYTLTNALAGRDLSNDSLAALTRAILKVLDSAFVCRDTECDLQSSIEFRASITEAFDSLIALGVTHSDASVTAEGLIRAGYLIRNSTPIVGPIPRAVRPMSPTLL